MKKLRILIDLDGIVCNTLPYWLGKIASRTKVVAQVADIKQWGMHLCPPLDQVDAAIIYSMLQDEYFTINIPPIFGAVEAVEQLMDDGHEVYLVTARHGPRSMPGTIEWLQKHMPFIKHEQQLVFAYNKHLIPGDVLIDDKAETLVQYHEHHPKALLMGIRYPYNEHLDGPGSGNALVPVRLFGSKDYLDNTLTWGAMYGYLRAHAEKE